MHWPAKVEKPRIGYSNHFDDYAQNKNGTRLGCHFFKTQLGNATR